MFLRSIKLSVLLPLYVRSSLKAKKIFDYTQSMKQAKNALQDKVQFYPVFCFTKFKINCRCI